MLHSLCGLLHPTRMTHMRYVGYCVLHVGCCLCVGCCSLHACCKGVMMAIKGALWAVASSVWDFAACTHDAQALCGMLHPLCGLTLAKTGNEDREPMLRTKTKSGGQRIRKQKDGEKERVKIFFSVSETICPVKKTKSK